MGDSDGDAMRVDALPLLLWLAERESALLDAMAYAMLAIAGLIALVLQTQAAPYGRYGGAGASASPRPGPPAYGYGFGINPRLAWMLQELPAFLLPLYLYSKSSSHDRSFVNTLLLLMFVSHYFQRTFIYSVLIRGGKPTPVMTFVFALIFCLYNGYLQGQYLAKYAEYQDSWARDPRFIAGCVVFLLGFCINIHSDHILRNLRKPGESGYKIPQGGMFEFVSGANFFGEMLEWSGFALASWSLPALSFTVFSLCNIGPRGCHHHRYYLEKFEDYPKNRKAIIPFLW